MKNDKKGEKKDKKKEKNDKKQLFARHLKLIELSLLAQAWVLLRPLVVIFT